MDLPNVINDDDQGDALRAKIISMVCLFSISMFVGCLPLLISLRFSWFTKSQNPNMRTSNKVVIGLLAFGGGVLFATTFMHLLPEVNENIELIQEEGDFPEMPIYLAGLIMCGGFFMMYLIEELVHLYVDSREKKKNNVNFSRVLSIRKNSYDPNSAEKKMSVNKEVETEAAITIADRKESHSHHGHSHLTISGSDDSIVSALRGLLIVLALSIHELFEGLAVGLESSANSVWYMFGAVSAHKYIIAFCIGVELLAAETKKWLSIVYIFTFSFVSALGIGIGILLVGGAGAAAAGIYSVILQGIACGTLLYVVFFEVWQQDRLGLLQFVFSIIGFTLMVLLQLAVALLA